MCKLEKPEASFKKNARRKDGLQSQCVECQKEYRRTHYLANRKKYIEKADKWSKEFVSWWKEYKKQFKCPCGESHPACIEFHHHDDNKEACVSQFAYQGCKQKLLNEIEKCTVLCSNCHKKLHYNERAGLV